MYLKDNYLYLIYSNRNSDDSLPYSIQMMFDSSLSIVSKELRKKGANKINIICTFALFTEGIDSFIQAYKDNLFKIGITGTKGKTTTSTFCAYLLEKLGYKTLLVGNMGIPSLELVEQAKNSDFVIIETSSYQASDLLSFPKTAILLNLFHDHVAWHLTYENYYRKIK